MHLLFILLCLYSMISLFIFSSVANNFPIFAHAPSFINHNVLKQFCSTMVTKVSWDSTT